MYLFLLIVLFHSRVLTLFVNKLFLVCKANVLSVRRVMYYSCCYCSFNYLTDLYSELISYVRWHTLLHAMQGRNTCISFFFYAKYCYPVKLCLEVKSCKKKHE